MKWLSAIPVVLMATLAIAQEEQAYPRLEASGYVKHLQALYFLDQPEIRLSASGSTLVLDTIDNPLLTEQFIHHRLNLQLHLNAGLRIRGALRSRLFYGEAVKIQPSFAASIADTDNDVVDLSLIWLRHSSMAGHSVVARLYLAWVSGDWEVRFGRQRINWGVATVWNPNDIFNAYAYTDFDYEERPGSDALRVTRYFGFGNSLEVALRMSGQKQDAVGALLYRFREGVYDIQLLAGYMQEYWTIGGAWAGNIGQAGWKGECSGFLPSSAEEKAALAGSMEFDYTLKGGWYVQAGMLVNTNGVTSRRITELFNFDLSARNLYPYPFTTLLRASYPVSPILNAALALLYSPGQPNPVFLAPVVSLSMAQDWDLDLVGQVVFEEKVAGGYGSPLQAVFLRVKWSY